MLTPLRNALEARRKAKGITYYQLAKLMGLDPPGSYADRIKKQLTGGKPFTENTAHKIADAMGLEFRARFEIKEKLL